MPRERLPPSPADRRFAAAARREGLGQYCVTRPIDRIQKGRRIASKVRDVPHEDPLPQGLKPEWADRCARCVTMQTRQGVAQRDSSWRISLQGRQGQCSGRKPVCRLKPESPVTGPKAGEGAHISNVINVVKFFSTTHKSLTVAETRQKPPLGGRTARAAPWLALPSYVTGQVIASDGGFEATGVGLPALRN